MRRSFVSGVLFLTFSIFGLAGPLVLAGTESPPESASLPDVRTLYQPAGIRVVSEDASAPGWEWGLELVAYGRAGDVSPVQAADPCATGNRVEYDRGTLVEWYVEEPRRTEQGFTLEAPPSADAESPLELVLRIRGSLDARLVADGTEAVFARPGADWLLSYRGLASWDARGRPLPSYLELVGDRLSIVVDDRDAIYPITVDPLIGVEEGKLTALDAAAGDAFGVWASIFGTRAAIGANNDDHDTDGDQVDDIANGGSAYVFVFDGLGWSEEAKLVASDTDDTDLLGVSVAITASDTSAASGDTVVAGAYRDDDQGSTSGSAYVFERTGTSWTETAKLLASDGAPNDEFGWSVDADGDTIVVGARTGDHDGVPAPGAGAADSGAVYVFVRDGTGWSEQTKLVATDPETGAHFGQWVAIHGDRLVVGAELRTDMGVAKGAAYVYDRTGTVWDVGTKLVSSDLDDDDRFGWSVGVHGDRVAVGARFNDDLGDKSGAAYVFFHDGTGWTEEQKLLGSDSGGNDQFGSAVSIFGDHLAVGAWQEDPSAINNAGSTYLFERLTSGWVERDKLFASDAEANDSAAAVVELHRDRVVVSAFKDDHSNLVDPGAAYVFRIGEDCNSNGQPDAADLESGRSQDCNENGVPDECDISSGVSTDCDTDGIPDECEADCNTNGTPDDCEAFDDCDSNGIPDECDPDCDNDGLPDDCEIDCNTNGTPDDCEAFDDCDSNGIPDECDPDCDNDGLPDDCEIDCNANGTPDDCEAFDDCDSNGIPDECDPDCDNDGLPDDCEIDCNANGTPDDCEAFDDCDSNGIPDECDPDCDNDGLPDDCEIDCNANGTPDDCEAFDDCDSNGIPDECDPDCDSDGLPDDCEIDCNANGTPDDCEAFDDCDANGIPDECDPDCDSDGLPDDCEIDCNANGTPDDCEAFDDCDANGIPDECDPDCDSDGLPDDCEIDCNANGTPDDCEAFDDCDSNGIPDECDPDCDNDGLPDDCEIDCNANGTPDDCEQFDDCNENQTPDECDILSGDSTDSNNNGVPDECECLVTRYCTSAPNSAGAGATIDWVGSLGVAENDFTVTASGLPVGTVSLFYYGAKQIQVPFGDGFSCVGVGQVGIFRLYPPMYADGNGTASRHVDFESPPIGSGLGEIKPFSTWNFQLIYRDTGAPGAGFNFTDALNVSFCP